MSISTPIPVPASAAAGNVPDPVLRRSTFNSDAQAFLYWLAGQTGNGDANFAALVANAYRNAEIAYQNAIAAAASAAANGATLWDASKNNYAMGDIVISPAALTAGAMNVVYICKLATAGTHIDPFNDLAHWSAFVISGGGVGGAVYTTSTTLTAASPFAISISGGAGVWLKLPNATTLSTGVQYDVRNIGENDLILLDSTGARIGFIRPQSGTSISLSDNTTAAGKWVGDWELYGITIDCTLPTAIQISSNSYAYSVKLTATKTLVVFGKTDSFYYFFVNDSSTQTNSAITLLTNIALASMADVITLGNGDYALAVIAYSSGFRTILINTNTLATNYLDSTAASSITSFGRLVATSAGAAYSYLSTNTGVIRAITVSGTTINIGPEVTMTAAEAPRLYSVGTSLVAVRHNNAQGITVTPYSISGTTLTAGTASTINCDSFVVNTIRSDKLTNNDILVCSSYSGMFKSHLFRLSGTVISQFNVVNLSWTSTYRTLDKFSHFDAGNGKLAIALAYTDGYYLFITLVDYSAATPTSSSVLFSIPGGNVYEVGDGFVAWNSYSSLDLSGASPAIKSIRALPISMAMDQNSSTYPKMDSMSACSNNLRSGLKSFITKGDNSMYNVGSLFFMPTSIVEKGSNVNPMIPFVQNFKSGSRKDSIILPSYYAGGAIKQVSIID